jgi:membrane protein DedA with SNARE-associated domain
MDASVRLMDNAEMKRPMNFGLFLFAIWAAILIALGWKQRNTIPLHWRTGANLPEALLVVGSLVGIVLLYVWWANRRDFK